MKGLAKLIVPNLQCIMRNMCINSANQMGRLSQSMKAPDGSLEIFGIYEFNESNPEGSLKELSELASFIKEYRPDAIQ